MTLEDREAAIAGISVAFLSLLKILLEKEVIDGRDLSQLRDTLTDLSGAYEIKPAQRAAIEAFGA